VETYARNAISDRELLLNAASHAGDERTSTAALLADIGEIDSRRLFVPAGYPTLTDYCRDALKLSEDAAARRIHAARTARRFPAIFAMCADGRLSLTAINMLAPHLTEQSAGDLLAAAAGRSKSEIDELIRARKPVTETVGWVQPLQAHAAPAPARVRPIARERFAVQGTVGKRAADALRFAQETTGGDLSSILEAALVLYEAHLRKRKCGATARPQARPRPTSGSRHVPAHVRRVVWARDGGRCAYTSDDGQRCGSRRRLQYDHVVPVARGGESTADNVRLLCPVHNFHAAERVFGAVFMAGRRERGRGARAARRAAATFSPCPNPSASRTPAVTGATTSPSSAASWSSARSTT